MPCPDLEIITIPCLNDNYAYLVNGPDGIALIDAPEAAPIIDALDARGWTLGVIMLTHHHWDHVDGALELKEKYGCMIMGPKNEQDKMPPLDFALPGGMRGGTGLGEMEVIPVPGHTLGHVAFYYPNAGVAFTADSLMALGCGRVFEGTPEMMWQSLSRLAKLPPETMIYSGHEYTRSNARFAQSVDPQNSALMERIRKIEVAREKGMPTAMAPLSLELATNPFLRASDPGFKEMLGMARQTDAATFAKLRAQKDSF